MNHEKCRKAGCEFLAQTDREKTWWCCDVNSELSLVSQCGTVEEKEAEDNA